MPMKAPPRTNTIIEARSVSNVTWNTSSTYAT